MTRLVFVTQLIDESDPALGFVPGWIRALAARCAVSVVANEVRKVPADFDVAELLSLGKERGRSRAARGMRYERVMGQLMSKEHPDAVVAHMCPSYLTLAAPLAKAFRVPAILWFTHAADSFSLAVAEKLSTAVATALPGSYPRRSAKVHVLGHGVDTARFRGVPPVSRFGKLELLALGRISPAKGLPIVLQAIRQVADAGLDVRLQIVGRATNPSEREHLTELETMIDALDLRDSVEIRDGVPPHEVPLLLASSTALVNNMVSGAADKVVFEAMAAGRMVLASGPVFASLLSLPDRKLTFAREDPDELAQRIRELAETTADRVQANAVELQTRVEQAHSLDHWADSMLELVRSCAGGDGVQQRPAQKVPLAEQSDA